MKKTLKYIYFSMFLPLSAFAWDASSSIVPKCNTQLQPRPQGGLAYSDPCNWQYLIVLANNILQFMVYLAVPIAAICFLYAGWLYLSARGNPGQISRAHTLFLDVFIGLVIVLVAWLVVDQIFVLLVDEASYVPVLVGGSAE